MKPNDDAASGACLNTDREIWREREGDAYADSIHVTEGGGVGINCGGMVFVKPVREWHRLAAAIASTPSQAVQAEAEITEDMVTAAMRAFERMSSVLRYREKDKWHTCDIMGMRDAIKAALASAATRTGE